jgi:hypothetical protein
VRTMVFIDGGWGGVGRMGVWCTVLPSCVQNEKTSPRGDESKNNNFG